MSQSGQDEFVMKVLKNKRNGYFLEIGSNDPILYNNTYLLEKNYDWKGLMVEMDSKFLPEYYQKRPNSIYVINDATKIDYLSVFKTNMFPANMDYLQIDLEVSNRSTLDTLILLDKTIFDEYKFATVTFEHDIYRGNYFNTREESRKIFQKRGYILVFPDVSHMENKFEDWYVHPDLLNSEYINSIKTNYSMNYKDIIKKL